MTLYEIGEMVCAVSFGHSFKIYLETVKQEGKQRFSKCKLKMVQIKKGMWDKKIFSLFFRAMANPGAKEQFLKQFENIVEGIKQNKAKVSITIHKLKSCPCLKS